MFTGVEFLVLSLCISGYDCSNGVKAYYNMPGVKEMVNRTKDNVKEHVGEDAIRSATFIAPFVALSTGKTASLRISKNWSIEGNSSEGKVVLQWSY